MSEGFSPDRLYQVLGIVFDIYITVLLLRFLLERVRADFYNPICQLLIKITDPALKPLRRLIPPWGNVDLAAIILMIGLSFMSVWMVSRIAPVTLAWAQLLQFTLIKLTLTLLMIYFVLILAAVLISWLGNNARHPVIPLVYQLTNPVLRPIQKYIPPMGGFDITPLLVLLLISLLMQLLGQQAISLR